MVSFYSETLGNGDEVSLNYPTSGDTSDGQIHWTCFGPMRLAVQILPISEAWV